VSRRDRIELLVKFLPEAINGGGGGMDWIGTGPDSKLLTLGPLYRSEPETWDELMRCLALLDGRSRLHLAARYHGGYVARRPVRFSKAGFPFLDERCEVLAEGQALTNQRQGVLVAMHKTRWPDCAVRVWPVWVDGGLVEGALRGLTESFRGPVVVPRELAA
jgi:hypothetical protein